MSDVYIAADCLAHPTQEDTFAMVVLEALAHGLPVIVSGPRYCGISGLLVNSMDALILDNPHNSTELANAVKDIATNTALQESLSQGGVALARSYLWSEIATQQERVYVCVINSSVGD
jgi:UDP-glucose:(heptosyl)LPS alpha-1,3-glucosyltransferase